MNILQESNLSKVIYKIDKYSTMGAEEAYKEGKHSSAFSAFMRAFFTFIQNYFLRLGLLDGRQGLTLAVTWILSINFSNTQS